MGISNKKQIDDIYIGGLSSILHAVVVPLFAFIFVLIYHPFDMSLYLSIGTFPFIARLAILYAILTGSMALTRTLLYLFRERITISRGLYAAWCVGEIILSGLFVALYVALTMSDETSFFDVARITLGINSCICIYPYIFLFFCLDYYSRRKEAEAEQESEKASLIRFYDEYHKLKFIVSSKALVYIKSEDNYLQIHYLDQQKVKRQILRSSMRAQEDVLSKHGLVRCHRSYFVNPEYIQVLHKDSNGALLAEFSLEGCEEIPVSRKYRDEMTSLL